MGTAALCTFAAVFVTMLLTACPNAAGDDPAAPAVTFVQISEATIVGKNPKYTLPETGSHYWRGVFIGGRIVKLSAYALSKTEVPYRLWKEVYDWAVKPENGYTFTTGAGKKGSNGNGSENEPVTMVSWRDCIVWCNAYTEKQNNSEAECVYRKGSADQTVLKDATNGTECDAAYADMSKKGFRLPTEAEWEYAARRQESYSANAEQYGTVWLTKLWSASGMKKPIGFQNISLSEGESWTSLRDELTRLAVYGKWWNDSDWIAQTPPITKTAAVGSKAANALGLQDMSGNVREWCWDKYGAVSTGTEQDPFGASTGSTNRMIRGGTWDGRALSCTVGARNDYAPVGSFANLGFRLAYRP